MSQFTFVISSSFNFNLFEGRGSVSLLFMVDSALG